jgi:hypothetical protein
VFRSYSLRPNAQETLQLSDFQISLIRALENLQVLRTISAKARALAEQYITERPDLFATDTTLNLQEATCLAIDCTTNAATFLVYKVDNHFPHGEPLPGEHLCIDPALNQAMTAAGAGAEFCSDGTTMRCKGLNGMFCVLRRER